MTVFCALGILFYQNTKSCCFHSNAPPSVEHWMRSSFAITILFDT